MRGGTLTTRAVLENPAAPVSDGDGGFTEAWAPLTPSPVWCALRQPSAFDLERVQAGSVQATATHLVSMRYHAGVTTQTRLTVGSRQLQVTGIQNVDGRNRELVLVCVEAGA